jgi:LacI family transcriptional regulator
VAPAPVLGALSRGQYSRRPARGLRSTDDNLAIARVTKGRKTAAKRELPRGESDPAQNRRPTINDVARLAKVSKKTVSRVINDSPFVRGETRERITAIMSELGYSPDPQARGLAFRRSFLIGLVYDNPSSQYVIDMQQGILDAVRELGFELIVHPCNRRQPNFLADVRSFVERQKLFGVVLPPSVSEDEELNKALIEVGCPYTRIASISLDEPARMVVTHDHRGAAEAARHLADLGHRRVAFVSGPDMFRSSHERRRGFAQGLADRGLKLQPKYVKEGAYTFESGIACAKKLLAMDQPPTAIFAGNDEMAAGVYRAAREAGLEIPRDLSVVGFDDSAICSKVWPPLTSVLLPIREMGRIAATKLLVEGGLRERVDHPEVSPTLVVRQSTASHREV